MKKLFLFTILVSALQLVEGQTLEEWTQQKKTQIKYLTTQIAALKVYASTIEKGYEIAHAGLGVIHDLKNGDFNLHAGYFASLEKISPKVKTYSKVARIILAQAELLRVIKGIIRQLKYNEWFSAREQSYVASVYNNLTQEVNDTMDELIEFTSDGAARLTDDERIGRIESLFNRVKDQYGFTQSFTSDLQILLTQKQSEQKQNKTLQAIYAINK